jgi:hypothetical protein
MTIAETERCVLQIVRDHWEGANVRNVQISGRVPRFFSGALYEIAIYDANGEEHENLIYVVGDEFWRYDDLKTLVFNLGNPPSFADTLQKMFLFVGFPGLISGVIGILVTACICYLAVTQPGATIPVYLANALPLILGFYFGTAVRK